MTPETLRDAFQRQLLPVSKFSLVVLDECHWASRGHPMAGLCELIADSQAQPRILGLTASPLNNKKGSLESVISKLLSITQTELVVPVEDMEDLLSYAAIPDMFIVRYRAPREYTWLQANSTLYTNKNLTSNPHYRLYLVYLRARHSYYLYTYYIFAKSRNIPLKDIPGIDKLNARYNLPETLSLSNGHLLDETQQFLFQALRLVEECGVLCAINALYFYCQTSRFHNGDSGSSFYIYVPSKTSINPDRIMEQILEIIDGPFGNEIGLLIDFNASVYLTLLDCAILLVSNLPQETKVKGLGNFKAGYRDSFDAEITSYLVEKIETVTLLSAGSDDFYKIRLNGHSSRSKPKFCFYDGIKEILSTLCGTILASLNAGDILRHCEDDLELEPWVVDGYDYDLMGNFLVEEAVSASNSLPFITSKLSIILKYIVDKDVAIREEKRRLQQDPWACIIFTQMRISCICISSIINMVVGHSLDDSRDGIRADYIIGVSQLKKQYQKLLDFKSGKFNLLLASSVAEEGIDVKVSRFPDFLQDFTVV